MFGKAVINPLLNINVGSHAMNIVIITLPVSMAIEGPIVVAVLLKLQLSPIQHHLLASLLRLSIYVDSGKHLASDGPHPRV